MDQHDFSIPDGDVPFDVADEAEASEETNFSRDFANELTGDADFPVETHEFAEASDSAESLVGAVAADDPFDFAGRTSQPFIGRWNHLVSRTNWDKGRIICDWRTSLIDSGAPQTAYSDDVWSRLVGSVTSQHVGRLRRVYLRFNKVSESYSALYWTHFQAALDWDDAEMWLQGALDNNWSVSRMRRQRWETLGAVAGQEPIDSDIVSSEMDEDFEPASKNEPGSGKFDESAAGPRAEGPDFGDTEEYLDDASGSPGSILQSTDEDGASTITEAEPAFGGLGRLPDDLSEALEAFQVAIVRHRSLGWNDVAPETVIEAIDGLKRLVLAKGDGRT